MADCEEPQPLIQSVFPKNVFLGEVDEGRFDSGPMLGTTRHKVDYSQKTNDIPNSLGNGQGIDGSGTISPD